MNVEVVDLIAKIDGNSYSHTHSYTHTHIASSPVFQCFSVA